MSNHTGSPPPMLKQSPGSSQPFPKWVKELVIIQFLLLIGFGSLLGIERTTDKLLTFFKHLLENPDILKAFSFVVFSIIVLAFLLAAILEGFRAYQRDKKEEIVARTTVQELKAILDPTKKGGPLYAFYEQANLLATPDHAKSPLHTIFKTPDGHLPAAVKEAKDHIKEARRLLGEIGENVNADKEIATIIEENHRDFRDWGDNWRNTANGLINTLKAEYFKKRGLLMEPADYAAFLHGTAKKHSQRTAKTYGSTVHLCGSMVGFAFLLPSSLRNHACRYGNFQNLKIISIDLQRKGKELFWYPVYLVAQTLKGMWINCDNIKESIRNGHTITIEVRYVDHDLLAALYDISGSSMAVLQSLDADNFIEILKSTSIEQIEEKRYQLGFRFDDYDREKDEYSRYAEAFDNLWSAYSHRSEVWVLHKFGDTISLKIWSPRWNCNSDNGANSIQAKTSKSFTERAEKVQELIRNRSLAEFIEKSDSADITISEDKIGSFLKNLVMTIPKRNSDIDAILKLFDGKNPQLNKLINNTCSCKIHKEQGTDE